MNKSNATASNWQEIVLELKSIAEQQGVTQDQIADRTGLIQSNVSRIFNLKFIPRISTLTAIAKALNVEIIIKK